MRVIETADAMQIQIRGAPTANLHPIMPTRVQNTPALQCPNLQYSQIYFLQSPTGALLAKVPPSIRPTRMPCICICICILHLLHLFLLFSVHISTQLIN